MSEPLDGAGPLEVDLLGIGLADETDFTARRMLPTFRKSTRNMILALVATERALAQAAAFAIDERTALVFGTAYGEIETTKDFLLTLADLRIARPLLFQNSLHNSTTGFLTLHFKLTGPALTVSSASVTGEESLNTAFTCLRSGICDRAIVTVTDSIPADLHPAFRALYGETGISEGSACVILARSADRALGSTPIARFPQSFRTFGSIPPIYASPYALHSVSEGYESDALHALGRIYSEGAMGPGGSLSRIRRDGGISLLEWEAP